MAGGQMLIESMTDKNCPICKGEGFVYSYAIAKDGTRYLKERVCICVEMYKRDTALPADYSRGRSKLFKS